MTVRPRKITQIATSQSVLPRDDRMEIDDPVDRTIVALCEDNSLWVLRTSDLDRGEWVMLPPVPDYQEPIR